MNYEEANRLASQQHPVRRPSWPEGHHVRHHVEESQAKLKLHTPDQDQSMDWFPGAEDQSAQDWEQYMPQAQVDEQGQPKQDESEKDEGKQRGAKHKK